MFCISCFHCTTFQTVTSKCTVYTYGPYIFVFGSNPGTHNDPMNKCPHKETVHTHTHTSIYVRTSHYEYIQAHSHDHNLAPPAPPPASLSVLSATLGTLTFTVRADTVWGCQVLLQAAFRGPKCASLQVLLDTVWMQALQGRHDKKLTRKVCLDSGGGSNSPKSGGTLISSICDVIYLIPLTWGQNEWMINVFDGTNLSCMLQSPVAFRRSDVLPRTTCQSFVYWSWKQLWLLFFILKSVWVY